jgi:predicted ATP-grasp superfamily ATP-dependent carboligase
MDMSYYKEPVIILGGDSVNVLAVSRNLGKNHVKVYYASSIKNEVSYSKYCQKHFIISDIEKNKEVLREFLLEIKKIIKDQAVLFPCSDLLCMNLSQILNDLDEKFISFVDKNVTPTLINKRKFYMSLYRNKVPYPNTYFPENYEDIKEIENSIVFPVLIKPAITQLFSRFNRKALIARSKKDLEKYYKLVVKYDIEFVIQEIIPGPPTNQFGIAGYFDKNHNPKGLFAYRRIREWPIGLGNGSLIESIPIHEVSNIKDIIINYLKNLKYCGLFDAEFKKDLHNGNFRLLEINARSWWQNHFPTICGINLVMMAYLDAIGEKIEYRETYETGVRWIHFINDVFSLYGMFKNRSIHFSEWVQSYNNIRDYAYFNADDALPWFINPLMVGPVYFRSLKRKLFK